METLELSQQELKILIGVFNQTFKAGGITIGDAYAMTPLAAKIQAKIKEETNNVKEEVKEKVFS